MSDLEEDYLSEHGDEFSTMSWSGRLCGSPTFDGGSRCLDNAGDLCFDDFGEGRQPKSPEEINTRFDLYTSPSSSPLTLPMSDGFDNLLDDVDMTHPWKIVVHGWRLVECILLVVTKIIIEYCRISILQHEWNSHVNVKNQRCFLHYLGILSLASCPRHWNKLDIISGQGKCYYS